MYVRIVRFTGVSAEKIDGLLTRIEESGGPPADEGAALHGRRGAGTEEIEDLGRGETRLARRLLVEKHHPEPGCGALRLVIVNSGWLHLFSASLPPLELVEEYEGRC